MARLFLDLRRRFDRVIVEWVEDHAPDAFRDERYPMRPFEVLDRILLEQFVRNGAQTRQRVIESPAAISYGLSRPVAAAWMEASRKRGIIVRRSDTHDAYDRPLPATEWELTELGQGRARKLERLSELRAIVKGGGALIALVGPALAVARAGGVEELPSWVWTVALWLVAGVVLLAALAVLPNEASRRASSKVAVDVLKERGVA